MRHVAAAVILALACLACDGGDPVAPSVPHEAWWVQYELRSLPTFEPCETIVGVESGASATFVRMLIVEEPSDLYARVVAWNGVAWTLGEDVVGATSGARGGAGSFLPGTTEIGARGPTSGVIDGDEIGCD